MNTRIPLALFLVLALLAPTYAQNETVTENDLSLNVGQEYDIGEGLVLMVDSIETVEGQAVVNAHIRPTSDEARIASANDTTINVRIVQGTPYNADFGSQRITIHLVSVSDGETQTINLRVVIRAIETPAEPVVTVKVVDQDDNELQNRLVRVHYEESDTTTSGQYTDENGEVRMEIDRDRAFHLMVDGMDHMEQYLVSLIDGQNQLCMGDDADDCSTNLFILVVHEVSDDENETDGRQYEIQLRDGWNLVSAPLLNASIDENNCNGARFFVYDADSGNYMRKSASELYIGEFFEAFWVKTNDRCGITMEGDSFIGIDDLKAVYPIEGWNLLGAPRESVNWERVEGTCEVRSGPWMYDTDGRRWERASRLETGKGYALKVADNCQLGDVSMAPPAFPDSSENHDDYYDNDSYYDDDNGY